MRSPFRLVIRTGPKAGQVLPLEQGEIFIGRDTSNDLVVDDPEVSRRHARLFLQGGNYSIEDLGSTNGTAVNNQRLMGPYILRPGDVITLGEHTNLAFEGVAADQASTVASIPPRNPTPPPTPAPTPAPPPQVYQQRPVPPPVPQAQPSYPPTYPPPPQSQYAGGVYEPTYEEPAPTRRRFTPLVIVLIILGACLLLSCIVFAIIDSLNLYCTLFPGIINASIPGYCP